MSLADLGLRPVAVERACLCGHPILIRPGLDAPLCADCNEINAMIRAELARRRMTQAQLAAALGLSQPSISMRLNGSLDWKHSEMQAVARIFGMRLTIEIDNTAVQQVSA